MIKKFIKSNPIHKKIVPSFDYFMLFRPTLFFSIWVMVCIGMYISGLVNNNVVINIVEYDVYTLMLYFGITLICGSCFILNQIADIKSDRINNKIFILNNIINPKDALNVSKVANIMGFGFVLYIDWIIAFPLVAIYIVWGILYNNEKYNWKSNPWLGLIANILCGYLLILCGIIYNRGEDLGIFQLIFSSIKYIFPFIFSYSSIILLANIPDTQGDESINKKTFTLQYGIKMTILISTLLCFLSFLLGLYLNEPLSSTSSITALPFFFFALFRGKNKDILRSIRYPIFLLNFYVLTIYPLLIFPIMIFYYLSKYYYWHRFNIHYPTLLVEDD